MPVDYEKILQLDKPELSAVEIAFEQAFARIETTRLLAQQNGLQEIIKYMKSGTMTNKDIQSEMTEDRLVFLTQLSKKHSGVIKRLVEEVLELKEVLNLSCAAERDLPDLVATPAGRAKMSVAMNTVREGFRELTKSNDKDRLIGIKMLSQMAHSAEAIDRVAFKDFVVKDGNFALLEQAAESECSGLKRKARSVLNAYYNNYMKCLPINKKPPSFDLN